MSEPLAPGRVLGGRYRLEHELARGGMGTVWEAEDPRLSRTVAVKTLDPAIAVDEKLRARFRREAVAAAAVAHPNIVATYDTGEDDGVAYIVMELVHGTTLRSIIDREGPLPVERAVNIAYQVADALSVAHARGLVHRDVKPGNVLVQGDGRVKVTDFGIAKAADGTGDDLTRSGMVVGTARYLAPEQVDGRTADERVDVYSLGLVLYEMLCGSAPFEGDTDLATAVARLHANPEPIATRRSDIPPRLAQIVDAALARDPSSRLPSAATFRDALAPFRDPGGRAPGDATVPVRLPPRATPAAPTTVASVPVAPAPSRGPRGWGRWVLWAGALALGLAVGFAAWRALSGGSEPARAAPKTAPKPAALPVVVVRDYDPPPGDGQEDHADVGKVTDGDPTTMWSTEQYKQRNVGGLKPGVGLVLDLGAPKQVDEVQVDSPDSDWNASIYVANTVPGAIGGWGPARAQGTGLGPAARFTLTPAARGRYVLVWITNLPVTMRLRVAEVRVLGLP